MLLAISCIACPGFAVLNNKEMGLLLGPLTRYVKLRVAHAPGMPGTFSPPPISKGRTPACITARAWRTCRDACRDRYPSVVGKTFPAFPAHAQTAIFRIWQEAHYRISCGLAPKLILNSKPLTSRLPITSSTHLTNRLTIWEKTKQTKKTWQWYGPASCSVQNSKELVIWSGRYGRTRFSSMWDSDRYCTGIR